MSKLMKQLVRRVFLISLGVRNCLFVLLEGKSSVNLLSAFYWNLPMGINYTSFGGEIQSILVRRNKLNYTEIFAGTHIYIGYVVIYIVLVTAKLVIELFYLTQLCSFLEC